MGIFFSSFSSSCLLLLILILAACVGEWWFVLSSWLCCCCCCCEQCRLRSFRDFECLCYFGMISGRSPAKHHRSLASSTTVSAFYWYAQRPHEQLAIIVQSNDQSSSRELTQQSKLFIVTRPISAYQRDTSHLQGTLEYRRHSSIYICG